MFVTISEFEVALGSSLSQSDALRAQQLIENATAAVISYTGQQFAAGTTTATLNPRRGWVRLGQRPVTAVSAVTDINGSPINFTWNGLDKVKVGSNVMSDFAWEPWRSPLAMVKVTYTHGGDIPADIKAVVVSAAGRAFGVLPQETALSQETLGAYNYSTGAAASSGAVGFLLPERLILDRYRAHASSIEATR